jgi:predicted dinucleotide-utilizing enzyme
MSTTEQDYTIAAFQTYAAELGVELAEAEAVGSHLQITLSAEDLVLVHPCGQFTHEGLTDGLWETFKRYLLPTRLGVEAVLGA